MRAGGRIDYVEIPGTDLDKAREFLSGLFSWSFQEWGPDYFSATLGGRRFHFIDPVGTEFAMWSSVEQ